MPQFQDKNKQSVLFKALKATFHDFANNTSIHGVKNWIEPGKKIWEKILWIVFVALGIAGSGFMLILFLQRFTSNPTRTSTFTRNAPTTAVPFPAVTLCTINRISHKKMLRFISKLEINSDDKPIVLETLGQLMGFTHTGIYNYSTANLATLERVLEENDQVSVYKIMQKITTTCQDMLLRCKWRFKYVDCMKIFSESFTTEGLCCSFNYKNGGKSSMEFTPYFGHETGLSLLIDPKLEEPRYSVFRSTGIKMIFHKSTDYPGIGATHKFIAAGKITYYQIIGTRTICSEEVEGLSIDQRGCSFPFDVSLRYFNNYTNPNCYTECNARQIADYCGCVPYFYWFMEKDVPICNISKLPCLADFSRIHYKNQSNCSCYSQCEDVVYNILSSSSRFVLKDYVTSSFLENITEVGDKIVLNIFFGSDTQTIYKRDTLTSSIYLLSSLGGVFSLFLGCSFLSLAEIIYHVTFRFVINLKNQKKKYSKSLRNKEMAFKQSYNYKNKIHPYVR